MEVNEYWNVHGKPICKAKCIPCHFTSLFLFKLGTNKQTENTYHLLHHCKLCFPLQKSLDTQKMWFRIRCHCLIDFKPPPFNASLQIYSCGILTFLLQCMPTILNPLWIVISRSYLFPHSFFSFYKLFRIILFLCQRSVLA